LKRGKIRGSGNVCHLNQKGSDIIISAVSVGRVDQLLAANIEIMSMLDHNIPQTIIINQS
jgi:hypothetical protein